MQFDIQDWVLSNPELVLIVTVLVLLVYQWQKGLSYHKYRYVHSFRVLLFRALDPMARQYGRPLVYEKATEGPEFVIGLSDSPKTVFHQLNSKEFSPHLIATVKSRVVNGQEQYCHSQLVYTHSDGRQTEAVLFVYNGRCDVYSHVETSVTDPEGHLTDPQEAGDARDTIADALETDVPR